jgi:predicted DNA-binding protein
MMYDSYIMRRTQIYLDRAQQERLSSRAEQAGVTSSHLIREAVEAYLADPDDRDVELARQRQALHDAFALPPVTRLPDGQAFVREARAADLEREHDLEEQWHKPV